MPRPYHSPSSIATGRRCQRAWAYCYIEGRRTPEVPWQESWAERLPEGVTPRMRSTALGKAMHAIGESWYRHEAPAWSTYPAQVFLSGAHLVPHPDRVATVHVEQAIGDLPHVVPVNAHAPPTALDVHGVRFAGFKDLVAHAPAELARLGMRGEWGLFDYKSTASIARYALTPATLLEDVQCNLYALDVLERTGLDEIAARWVYFETKRKRQALPVDVVVTRAHALTVLQPIADVARELDAIESVEDATPNPDACGDYGGCEHHVSQGGPCKARRALGLQIARNIERQLMTPEMQKKLDDLRAKSTGAAPTTDPPADAPATDTGAPDETPAPATPTRARAPRAAKAKATAPAGSLGATMAELAAELTEAEAAAAAAVVAVDAVRARMVEALA